ncbi:ATP-grasp domain-containing protein [Candidatus Micrarchaeota archaeon]|nr:ATP-grasp domain-containing protein [Candidatus Micrarchaeota archaeon]
MKKVAVVCSNKRERENLKRSKHAESCKFILVGTEDGAWRPGFSITLFLKEQLKRLKDVQPDAIIGTDDYPGCPVSSYLAGELGLVSPSLKSILLSQHKYFSRQIQKKVLPKQTPDFNLVDLKKKYSARELPQLPFFIKPVKYYLSHLAERVNSYRQFEQYLKAARKKIPKFTRHMEDLVEFAGNGLENKFNWQQAIIEDLLSGKQATYEGFVYDGNAQTFGIVDSIRYPNRFSFKRFQYPSKMPEHVRIKIEKMAEKAMKALGFNNSMFNIEFFYDETKDEVKIIEINPRMATQFANLYQAVDGVNSYDVQIDLALGKEPSFTRGNGKFKTAASFAERTFADKFVISVPSRNQADPVKKKFHGSSVEIIVKPKKKLSQTIQDGQSFRYMIVNLAGKNEKDLFRKYDEVLKMLPFRFKDLLTNP